MVAPLRSKVLRTGLLCLFTVTSSVKAGDCVGDDPIACREGVHQCVQGEKSYGDIFPDVFETNKRGMFCECNEQSYTGYSGFTDVHCYTPYTVCPYSSVCLNGGICQKTTAFASTTTYSCSCPQDSANGKLFAGTSCEYEVTPLGICKETNAFTEVNGGKWFCANGGICDDSDANIATKCDCPKENGKPLFYGLHCEFPEEESSSCTLNCENGGVCRNGVKDYSSMAEKGLDVDTHLGESSDEHCVCPEGFAGQTCEITDVVPCGTDGFCFNGQDCLTVKTLDGKIYSHECVCDWGFGGRFCEIPRDDVQNCPAPDGHDPASYYCAHGGLCGIEPYMPCTDCDEGYYGPRCEMHSDDENPDPVEHCDLDCKHGGTCYIGTPPTQSEFDALPGFTSSINNRYCRCPEGYTGTYCDVKVTVCGAGEHYCLHSGSTCVKDNDKYTCDCELALASYAGDYCEHIATEFCAPANKDGEVNSFCTNNGACKEYLDESDIDHVGCICHDGYSGDFCEYPSSSKGNTTGNAGKVLLSLFMIGVLLALLSIIVSRGRRARNGSYGNSIRQFFPVTQASSRDGEAPIREMS